VATSFTSGLLLGASLIAAIGAQNAFILRQGLLRQHVFVLGAVCALSDAALIALGVAGLGAIVSRSALLLQGVTGPGARLAGKADPPDAGFRARVCTVGDGRRALGSQEGG